MSMHFEVSIDMDKASGATHIADALAQLAEDIAQGPEPDGAGNVEDTEGEVVGFWQVRS